MKVDVVLTVSESKRLIAKGVANLDIVKKALKKGMVAIAKGTTNSYVVEEILGKKIDKTAYTTGITQPAKGESGRLNPEKIPDIVLKDGKIVDGLTVKEAVHHMSAGDVFIKGGNALNYEQKMVGILIGDPTGGTIGTTWGRIVGERIHLVIPIGLEKSVPTSIITMHHKLAEVDDSSRTSIGLFPVTGHIITEIEALKILTGVCVWPISAGGIAGAEGSVRLLIEGDKSEVERGLAIVKQVQGEPPFVK